MKNLSLVVLMFISGCQLNSQSVKGSGVFYSSEIINRKEIAWLTAVQPDTPERVTEEGITGGCLVKFDLEKSKSGLGVPSNIEIISCKPEGIFEESCVWATKYLRFMRPEKYLNVESTKGIIHNCEYKNA